jgi:hypothetical protein
VEPAVEVGKVVIAMLDFSQQSDMLVAQRFESLPEASSRRPQRRLPTVARTSLNFESSSAKLAVNP